MSDGLTDKRSQSEQVLTREEITYCREEMKMRTMRHFIDHPCLSQLTLEEFDGLCNELGAMVSTLVAGIRR